MSLDAVISADLVKTRAEIAALSSAVAIARSEIAGLNTQVISRSAIKSLQRIRIQPSVNNVTHVYHSDVTISAIDPQKTIVLVRETLNEADVSTRRDCEILNATTLRCSSYGYYVGSSNAGGGGLIDIQVVEFN
ncbi:hypothetical protein CLV01_2515 [Delftia sp. 60]|uniref:hypothetical protein n=1 Tax=Delftia sp. 60 TaxID=2035216 RepID=UPI000C17483D|nr:hypothetical protein [Delftia sp. 60]PIF38670.1 hypothetical protein CLU98_3936 [Burkholderiales bacterium 23]PIF66152.1 hypothetical protein CLV01_2515 [Delftia sp. 60]